MVEDGDFGKYPKGLNILIFSRGHLLNCSWVCFGNSRLLTLPGELTPYVVIYDVLSSQNIVDVRSYSSFRSLVWWSFGWYISVWWLDFDSIRCQFCGFWYHVILESIELICLYLDHFRLVLTKKISWCSFFKYMNLVVPSMIIVKLMLAHSKIEIFHLLMSVCALN